jgi:hypothetical protein
MKDNIHRQALLNGDRVLFEHIGEVTKDVVLEILPQLEAIVENQATSKLLGRRLIYIAIETLQNLQLHGYSDDGELLAEPEFIVSRSDDAFNLHGGNIVPTDAIEPLTDKIAKINSLNEEELKYLYGVVMKQTVIKFSTKGGAGLGLIDMRKKSTRELEFSIQPLDEDFSYFTLKVSLPESL